MSDKVTPLRQAKKQARADDGGGDRGWDGAPPHPPGVYPEPPFLPIGVNGEHFILIDALGQKRVLRARDLGPLGLMSLCGGDLEWLATVAPPGKQGQFESQKAAAEVMAMCREEGLVDLDMPVRGPGVWLDPDGVGLVVHCGDQVNVAGEWRDAGFRHGPAFYIAAPPVEAPAGVPIGIDRAAILERGFKLWAWKYPEAAAMMCTGVTALATLGAAPHMRAHLVLTGDFEVGKTSLMRAMIDAIGPLAFETNDARPAGLAGALNGRTTVVFYDEAEGTVGAQDVLATMRRMSGREGVKGVRGTGEGNHRSFTLSGTMVLGAIHPPDMKPEDRSRIVELDMVQLDRDASGDLVKRFRAWAGAHSAAMRARMLDRWYAFGPTLDIYRKILRDQNCTHRVRDLYGHVLAARSVFLRDREPTELEALDDVAKVAEVIGLAVAEQADRDGDLALKHLVTSSLDDWRAGQRLTVAHLIKDAFSSSTTAEGAGKALRMNGIRVDGEKQRILVASHHRALERIFFGTRWQGRAYIKALGRLEGAELVGTVRFDGSAHRAIAVPRSRLDDGAGQVEVDEAAAFAEAAEGNIS